MSSTPPAPSPAAVFAWLWPDLSKYLGTVSRTVSRWSGCDRDDLFQCGAVAVWVAVQAGDLAASDDPKRWACQRAKFAVLTAARTRANRVCVAGPLDADAMADALAVTDRDPDEWGTLVALVENPTDRRVIVERFADGRKFRDIAAGLGVTDGAVKQRVGRVLGELAGRVG